MALKKQLSVPIVNQAGEGVKLCGILKEAGINIEAISVCEFTEGVVVRLIVSDDKKATNLLRDKGYGVLVRVVVALELENKPGALGEVMAKLAENGYNINYCYGSATPGGNKATIFLAIGDAVKADMLFS